MLDKQDQGIIDPANNLGSQESSLDNEGAYEDGEAGSAGDPNRSIIQQQKKNQQLENIKEAEDEQLEGVHNKSSNEMAEGQNSLEYNMKDQKQPHEFEDSMLQPSTDAKKQEIEYERLSEFFFDLCLSWCQHLDIETYIFFLNGIFLNITQGSHVNVSTFKEIEQIEVLSVEFFNRLLNYRNRCEENLQQGQTYADWYAKNFGRSHQIAASVQRNLQESFDGKGEQRILDLFMDLPKEQENSYLSNQFVKLDKDFAKIDIASKTAGLMT